METVDFNAYLTKEEQRAIAEEANRMATHLIFEDPDQLSTAVKLCFDNLRYLTILRRMPPPDLSAPLPPPDTGNDDETETAPCEAAPVREISEDYRLATSAEAVNAHPEAIFATLQVDFTGNVQLRTTNSPERALVVVINNNIYPNPLYFADLDSGAQSNDLQRLLPVFHLD